MSRELEALSEAPPADRITVAPVKKALTELVELRAKHRAVAGVLDGLNAGREAAVAEDLEASAKAVRAGRKDPGTPNLDRHHHAVNAAEHDYRVYSAALEGATAGAVEAVRAHAGKLEAAARKHEAETLQALRDWLETGAVLLAEHRAAIADREFAKAAAENPRAARWLPSRACAIVPGVTAYSGELMRVDELVAGLAGAIESSSEDARAGFLGNPMDGLQVASAE